MKFLRSCSFAGPVVLSLLVPAVAAAGPGAPRRTQAAAKPTAQAKPAAKAPAKPASCSIGSPTDGHLVGGARLPDGPHIRIVPCYTPGDVRWGLESLVGLIDRAGKAVKKQFPDAILSVGHLSRAGGGSLERHASHESGRDADVGFFVRNQQGKALYADHFVAFLPDGTAPSWPGAHFDDAKNWALVSALLSDPHARITHIFVAQPLRTRLLSYAEKVGAPHAIRVRASETLAQPHGSLPHDDHFHVRIACPPGMDKCVELPVARRHVPAHGTAVARGHGPAPSRSHATPKPHAPAPAHPKGKPAPQAHVAPPRPSAKADADAHEEEAAKSELVPSLAPAIQGLDSAVIPAPLVGPPATPPAETATPAPTPPPPQAVDDPDGVLEPHH